MKPLNTSQQQPTRSGQQPPKPSAAVGVLKAKRFIHHRGFHLLILAGVVLGIWAIQVWLSGQTIGQALSDFGQQMTAIYGTGGRWFWLVKGLGITLAITGLSLSLGIVIALGLTAIRSLYRAGARIGFLNTLAELYITVIRGTPVTVQLLIIYFGIFASVDVNPVLSASLAFGINSGAYVAEMFRAGLESIDPGQTEAGLALGLTQAQVLRKILLPQAVKNILPTLFNEVIALLKETAVAGYVGVTDLTRAANDIRSKSWSQSPLYVTALIYLVLVLGLTALLARLERRLKHQ